VNADFAHSFAIHFADALQTHCRRRPDAHRLQIKAVNDFTPTANRPRAALRGCRVNLSLTLTCEDGTGPEARHAIAQFPQF
jgi:hypothetical protein